MMRRGIESFEHRTNFDMGGTLPPGVSLPSNPQLPSGKLWDQVSSLILRLLGIDPKTGGQRYLSSKESPCSGQPISDNRHSASLEKRRVAPSCLTDVFSINMHQE